MSAGAALPGLPDLAALHRTPEAEIESGLNGARFRARLGIPNYARRLAARYGADPAALPVPFEVDHFGVVVTFERPVELAVHDAGRVLDEGLRAVVGRFGPVILRNAYLPERGRAESQRNIFQSLRFHIDRGTTQADHYSLFWRDPFDPVQRAPRTSSTLILPNAAAYLQALKEGAGVHAFRALYDLFRDEDVPALMGDIILEQAWRAPEGTGEIALLDNRTVLHASYYARARDKGYPIAVRYLY
jgi:hypothetical protein